MQLKRLFFLLLLCVALCARVAFAADAPTNADDDADNHWNPNKNVKAPKKHHDFVNSETWTLEDVGDCKADGVVTLTCYSDDKDNVLLKLRHLPKHSVFTAWVASSMKDEAKTAGLGDKPFSFKTGNSDSLEWGRMTEDCPLAGYRWIVIRQHPDGDPTHLDNSVVILKAHMLAH
jgi:hypothetical protein